MLPNAFRPLRNEYIAVAKIVSSDVYVNYSLDEFTALFMKYTNGTGCPKRAREIYSKLMKDCGNVHYR